MTDKNAATRYGKYFLEYDPSRWPKEGRPVMARVEDSVMSGSNFYLVHWVFPGFGESDQEMGGHPTHIHKHAELLFHIGTNPDDPMDLGAEVEIYMGKEMEKHVFNRTTVIYIPPNFIHCPMRFMNTKRPWIFIQVNQGPAHTEKSFRQLLPKEVRERIDWSKRWHDDGY